MCILKILIINFILYINKIDNLNVCQFYINLIFTMNVYNYSIIK